MCYLRTFSNRQCDFNHLGVPENSRKHTWSYYMLPGLSYPWCSDIAATRDPCPYIMRIVLRILLHLVPRSRNKRHVPTRACICLPVDFSNLHIGWRMRPCPWLPVLGPSGSCWLSSSLSLFKLYVKITPMFKVSCKALEKKVRRPSLDPNMLQFP